METFSSKPPPGSDGSAPPPQPTSDLEAPPPPAAPVAAIITTTTTTTAEALGNNDDDVNKENKNAEAPSFQNPGGGNKSSGIVLPHEDRSATATAAGFAEECIEDVIAAGSTAGSASAALSASTSPYRPTAAVKSAKKRSRKKSSSPQIIVEPAAPLWNRVTHGLAGSQVGTTLLALAALILAILAYVGGNDNVTTAVLEPSGPETAEQQPIENVSLLETIVQRGYLQCGLYNPRGNTVVGFADATTTTTTTTMDSAESAPDTATTTTTPTIYEGLDVDLCRSLSAALFGVVDNADQFFRTTLLTTSEERWARLNDTSVDVIFSTAQTMQHDVYVPELGTGVEFTRPYYFDGVAFGGIDEFVDCAEQGLLNETCADWSVCVFGGSDAETVVANLFPNDDDDDMIVRVSSEEELQSAFPEVCQVIAASQLTLVPAALQGLTTTATRVAIPLPSSYKVGTQLFSRQPLALATRQGDPRWSDFVQFVLQALIFAEENEITQTSAADQMPSATTLYGEAFANMFRHAVQAVGNYGELYDRHLEQYLPRAGSPHRLNTGTTPRKYNVPFGNLQVEGPRLERASPTVQAILDRGFLRCGTTPSGRPFSYFEETTQSWRGYSNDFCRALAAAIFDGVADDSKLVFVSTPIGLRFQFLQEGRVDYLPLSTTWTAARDVREESSAQGLAYTTVTHQVGTSFAGVPEFVECANNLDVFSPACQSLRVCVVEATTFFDLVVELLGRDFYAVGYSSTGASFGGLRRGECNTIFAPTGFLIENTARTVFGLEPDFPYSRGSREFQIDQFGTVTREDDPLWNDFVRWVHHAQFYADENGITRADADESMPRTSVFGPLRTNALYHAVNADGNFQEHWDRDLGPLFPREQTLINQYADWNDPLIFSIPGLDDLE